MKAIVVTEEPISPAQINEWKVAHKNVFAIDIEIELNAEEERAREKIIEKAKKDKTVKVPEIPLITGYFRRPTIEELGLSVQGNKGNELAAGIILYNTCFLGGHPSFQDDDGTKMSALRNFKTIVKPRESTIKKL